MKKEESFKYIKQLIKEHPYNFHSILKSHKEFDDILNQINTEVYSKYDTELLKKINYDNLLLGQKLFILFSTIDDIEITCQTCGKKFINTKLRFSYNKKCCSKKCMLIKRQQEVEKYNLEHYGTRYLFDKKEFIKECINKKYGVDNPFQAEEVKEKIRKTNLEKYGVEYVMQCKDIQEKAIKTYIDRYGVNNPSKNKDVIQKIHNTTFKKYGVYHVSHYYTYDNISFDSTPELALYIYLKDNNIDFEYQPKLNIEYEHNGKVHRYCPDFLIEGKVVEIKGDHFFRDGKMINPFSENQNDIAQAKYECMLKNNVTIILEDEYMKYIEYVESKYGKDYLKQFKRK